MRQGKKKDWVRGRKNGSKGSKEGQREWRKQEIQKKGRMGGKMADGETKEDRWKWRKGPGKRVKLWGLWWGWKNGDRKQKMTNSVEQISLVMYWVHIPTCMVLNLIACEYFRQVLLVLSHHSLPRRAEKWSFLKCQVLLGRKIFKHRCSMYWVPFSMNFGEAMHWHKNYFKISWIENRFFTLLL